MSACHFHNKKAGICKINSPQLKIIEKLYAKFVPGDYLRSEKSNQWMTINKVFIQ
jgi:hypothetical protein